MGSLRRSRLKIPRRPQRSPRSKTPADTAIRRRSPSRPVRLLKELTEAIPTPGDLLLLDRRFRVLDYGCGWGADVSWLTSVHHRAIDVVGFEPPWISKRLRQSSGRHQRMPTGSFDLVILNYVLNTIEEKEERVDVLRRAWSLVGSGGSMFVATRSFEELQPQADEKRWRREGDGWRTEAGTFQVGFDDESLRIFVDVHLPMGEVEWIDAPFEEESFGAVLVRRTT